MPYSLRLLLAYQAAKQAGFDGFASALLKEYRKEISK
jgi:predicted adenine nucleotide alpha hydrolase (AANH) superfamily ATPase